MSDYDRLFLEDRELWKLCQRYADLYGMAAVDVMEWVIGKKLQ